MHGEEKFRCFQIPEELDDCKRFIKKLQRNNCKFVMHNGKFDSVRLMYSYGIDVHIDYDTMILGYLTSTVDELKNNKGKWLGLKYIAPRILGVENWDIALNKKTSQTKADVYPYLKCDCKYTYQLLMHFLKTFPEKRQDTLNLVMKAINAYRDIELNGLPIDKTLLDSTRDTYKEQQLEVDKELEVYGDINYNSSQQLQDLLYVKLQLPIVKYTDKGQPSTGVEVLKELVNEHPIIPLLLKKRKIEKALAFLDSWEECAIKHNDGHWYLHSNFNLHGTVTGRTSSSDVNLQQIPRDKTLKTLFRSCDTDWELVCLDYSQLELRFAGIVADVKAIADSYIKGEDLHYKMASVVTGKPVDQITKEERTQAKAANFGFLYGMQASSFVDYAKASYGVTVTPEQAQDIRYHFFELYPELNDYYDEVRGCLLTDGKLTSIMRREYELNPEAMTSDAMRAAINFPVQSAGSDYVISGLIEVLTDPELKDTVRIGATVHDSMIGLVKKDEHFIERIRKIKSIMEHPKLAQQMLTKNINMPIVVDVEIGPLGKGISIEEYLAKQGE